MEKICGIYKISFIPEGSKDEEKIYIGQSIDIYRMWKDHKNKLKNGTHANNHLQRAYNKYGECCFDFSIVEECTEQQLDEREMYYISYYDSMKHGYNQETGGYHNYGKTFSAEVREKKSNMKKVCQLDIDGSIIKIWNSSVEAATALGITAKKITACCNIGSPLKRHGGFFWVYLDDYESGNIPHNYFHVGRKRPVSQYDTNMNLLNSWDSVREAAKCCGLSNAGIYNTCCGRNKTCGGYIFRFSDTYTNEQYEDDKKNKHVARINKIRPVNQYDINGNMMCRYTSASDAARAVGASSNHIGKACKHMTNMVKGFFWRYADENIQKEDIVASYNEMKRKKMRAINQFDKNGNFIKQFDSAAEIESEFGINANTLSSLCYKSHDGFAKVGGFIWKYASEPTRIKKTKKVIQCDLNGDTVCVYESIKNAVAQTGISYYRIYNCCTGNQANSGGFIWRYAEEGSDING